MLKGMEALDITDALMAEHGLANVGPALAPCHNGMQAPGNGS